MTTAAEVIRETKERFLSSMRPEVNKLNGQLTDSVTSVVVEFETGGIKEGATIQVDQELMYVWSYAPTTKTATVERGWDGSTAAAHDDDSLVYVNPIVTDVQIFREINNELRSLSAPTNGLYRVATLDTIYNDARIGFDLTGVTMVDEIIAVFAEQQGAERNWVPLPPSSYQLVRNQDTDEFASGFAIRLLSGPFEPGRTVRLVLKQAFTTLSGVDDDVESVSGLPSTAIDLLSIGAAIRLASSREVARNLTEVQSITRRAEEVPPGALQQAAAGLRQLRRERIAEEAARLQRQYGL